MITITSNSIVDDKREIYNLDIINNGNEIIIKNLNFVCPQFYFFKEKNDFVLTTKANKYSCFSPKINISHSVWEIDGIKTKMLNCGDIQLPYQIINNYKEIRVTRTGEIKVEENDFSKLYSVPIEDSKELILEWREKYLDLASDLIKQDKFIPTLTGGCDTRILTYFWRKHNLKEYKCHLNKNGSTKEVCMSDVELAKQVSKKINKMNRIEMSSKHSFSGCYSEQTKTFFLLNDKNFITRVVNRCNSDYRDIYPFLDDNYLMIKPNQIYELRVLFLLLFCPDLLEVEFISGKEKYKFNEFGKIVDDCKELIKRWNI